MIEQPDSEKPRDEWSDPRTTPAVSDNQENAQLQADLDAAVDAEPAFPNDQYTQVAVAQTADLSELVFPADSKVGDVIEDSQGNTWTNAGKAFKAFKPAYRFRAINSGNIVYAQAITAFRDSQDTAERFIVLSDKTERPRPITHGYIPKVGDYFVQATPITVLSVTQAYIERGETMMMGKRLFESLYYPAEE